MNFHFFMTSFLFETHTFQNFFHLSCLNFLGDETMLRNFLRVKVKSHFFLKTNLNFMVLKILKFFQIFLLFISSSYTFVLSLLLILCLVSYVSYVRMCLLLWWLCVD